MASVHSKVELSYVKINTSGNTSILVTDLLPREHHLALSKVLMSPLYLSAEQVGFLEESLSRDAACRLQMMGGEFCSNASRAMAALLVEKKDSGIEQLGKQNYPGNMTGEGEEAFSVCLEVSGSKEPVQSIVVPLGKGLYWTEASVPPPLSVEEKELEIDRKKITGRLVKLPGIEHLVLEDVRPSNKIYDLILKKGCFSEKAEAWGIIFFDSALMSITPLVTVEGGTPVWERSCGSGSIAVAAGMAHKNRSSIKDLRFEQPGGELTADIEYKDGKIESAVIKGPVEIISEGKVLVPLPGSGIREKIN